MALAPCIKQGGKLLVLSSASTSIFRRCYSSSMLTSESDRIYILGVGNLGCFFAHALATLPEPPPITLLFHRPSLVEEWKQAGRKIGITRNGVLSTSANYDIETIDSRNKSKINNLIITTKTTQTLSAFKTIRNRLDAQSPACVFAQNGMGFIAEIEDCLEPDVKLSYSRVVTNHGLYSTAPFRSVHAGHANMFLCIDSTNRHVQYILRTLAAAPLLNATPRSQRELSCDIASKLAVNAMINPLTATFRCKNGELFGRPAIKKLMLRLLEELRGVFEALHEKSQKYLQHSKHVDILVEGVSFKNLDPRLMSQGGFLESTILDVALMTAENTSSMLQDVKAGRETEIDYINGWIVRQGRALDVPVELNEKLVQMVMKKSVITVDDIEEHFPSS